MDRNIRVALYIGLGLIIWFASGLIERQNDTLPVAIESGVQSVQVGEFSPRSYRPRLTLRAVTQARRAVDVRAEVGGILLDRPQPQGATVSEGDVICRLDPRARPQALAQAQAALQVADLDYQGALRLRQAGIQSELAIAKALAQLENSRVALRRAEIEVANSNVVAPFAGVVERIVVERGDLLQPGQSCALLLQLNPIKIVAYVTEQEIALINAGDWVEAQLVTGQVLNGQISYLARSDEGATHSYRIEALAENDGDIAEGVSASMRLLLPEVTAVQIPAHLMVLDRNGKLVVRSVNSEKRVVEWPVKQVDEELSGVWVTGINQPLQLITVGQNYVAAGDIVEPVLVNSVDAL